MSALVPSLSSSSYWCSTSFTDEDVLNALALCEMSNTGLSSQVAMEHALSIERSNTLFLPLLEIHKDEYIVAESSTSIYICISMSSILWEMFTLQQRSYAFGGSIHKAFLNHITKWNLFDLVDEIAVPKEKNIIFCGHSLAGSMAQLAALYVLYEELPLDLQTICRTWNGQLTEAEERGDVNDTQTTQEAFEKDVQQWMERKRHEMNKTVLPRISAIGFGATQFGCAHINTLVGTLGWGHRFVTVVNGPDVIPGALNAAQSMAILTKTAERLMMMTTSIRALLRYGSRSSSYRVVLQGAFANMTTSYSAACVVSMVNRCMSKLKSAKIMEQLRYAPCGAYVALDIEGMGFQHYTITDDIEGKLLYIPDASLTGDAFLQHRMQAYASNIRRRVAGRSITESMNYYERLNIPHDATVRDIRTSYRTLALKWHPDKWSLRSGTGRSEAEEKFKLLAEAFEVLSDVVTRKEYDDALKIGESVSYTEELLRKGTVGGMTVDEAIARFSEAFDVAATTLSKFSSVSSSTTTAASQASSVTRSKFQSGNHKNIFIPDKMRVVRDTAEGSKATYVDADDLLPTDLSTGSSLKTRSVVGGAVAVGAGVAIVVGAWSMYSGSTRKARQAHTVSTMKPEYLSRLIMDAKSQEGMIPLENETSSREKDKQQDIVVLPEQLVVKDDEDDVVLEEFFDCVSELELATEEMELENVFYECMELESQMDDWEDGDMSLLLRIQTPFGFGTITSRHAITRVATVRIEAESHLIGYVQESALQRYAASVLESVTKTCDDKTHILVEKVLVEYALQPSSGAAWGVLKAGTDGALDGGVKAASGMVLAKGMSRLATASASAPLAIASILVDIGKEYLDYRSQRGVRSARAMNSEASEHILMNDFRQKIGHHIVSGTAAAAGASIGAYSLSALVTYSGAALAGPFGILAATSVAVVGGVVGYFSGSSLYHHTSTHYFESYYKVREDIHRLEAGARVLFSEFDPDNTGEISRTDCIALVRRLRKACGNSISDDSLKEVIDFLSNETFTGVPITWKEYWEWVSTQALQQIRHLEKEHVSEIPYASFSKSMYPSVAAVLGYTLAKQPTVSTSILTKKNIRFEEHGRVLFAQHDVDGFITRKVCESIVLELKRTYGVSDTSLKDTLSYLNDPVLAHTRISFREFDDWLSAQVSEKEEENTSASETDTSAWEKARIQNLVDAQMITREDGRRMKRVLRYGAQNERNMAWHTLAQLSQGVTEMSPPLPSVIGQAIQMPSNDATDQDQLDVLCSLLSMSGMRTLLRDHGIDPPDQCTHEELHSVVLLHADHISSQIIPPVSKHSKFLSIKSTHRCQLTE